MRSRTIGGWLLAAGVVTTTVVGACADPKGAIMLAINTDMRAPKDVNAVSVTISTNGAIKHSFIGRVTPQGEVLLPATLAIVEPEDRSASIRIRVMAFQDRKPRVLRDVRTTIPQNGRTALLRIPLNFVNDGMLVGAPLPAQNVLPPPNQGTGGFTPAGGTGSAADAGGEGSTDPGIGGNPTSAADFDFFGAFQPPCDDIQNQTIIEGECKDNFVDPATLPDFEGTPIGDSTDQGSCFDLPRCFGGAVGVGEGDGNRPPDAGVGPADSGPPAVECESGLTFCTNGCVDLQTDAKNCGACTKACPVENVCNKGVCGPRTFKDFGVRLSAVTLDKATCALQLNGAQAARLNIALVTPDTGECVRPGECYVPIDRGGAGGWKEENGRVQLPTFVCKLLTGKNLRLATSTEVCAAKEEANPICTPKPGDPVPVVDSGDTGGAVRVVPEDFATATVAIGPTLFFASASRVGFMNVLTPIPANAIGGIPANGAHLPWRFSNPFSGPLALANGGPDGYVIGTGDGAGVGATTVTVAPGTFAVSGLQGSAPLVWAVRTADTSSFYTSQLQGAATKSPLNPNFIVTAITSNDDGNSVVVGDMGGNVRVCVLPEQCFTPAVVPSGGRVDAMVARSDRKGGYILSAGGIARVIIQASVVELASVVAADLSGVDENGAHFPRGLATNDRCVFFTSKDGLSYVNEGAPQSGAKILVPSGGRQFLGVSLGSAPTGPAGSEGNNAVYYTVFSGKDLDGGVWRVSIPSECNGGTVAPPADAGADSSAGDGGAQLCGPANCGNGCCAPAGGGCRVHSLGQQSPMQCGHTGNPCTDCGATSCTPFGQAGGVCGGG